MLADPLSHVTLVNIFRSNLPGDKIANNYVRHVKKAFWSSVLPTPVVNPRVIAYSNACASSLGLQPLPQDADTLRMYSAEYLAGNKLVQGSEPIAQAYVGWQFGQWAGQLGDGRAIQLGELKNQQGEVYSLQLKGAGKTPYSRTFDGRAVLRSSIREFLCSEAMYGLGVPTTRALALVWSKDCKVYRDKMETAGIVCRASPSWIRFGSFELAHSQQGVWSEGIKQLADYTIQTHFPEIQQKCSSDNTNPYAAFTKQVVTLTAQLVAHWQAVGFVHGVLNTDNMSILGITLDYGPFGFLDNFDPQWTSNTEDHMGRYSYHAQPSAVQWNVARFAITMAGLMNEEELADAVKGFYPTFEHHYLTLMRAKLGLHHECESDGDLIKDLLNWLKSSKLDYTQFFRTVLPTLLPSSSLPKTITDLPVELRERLATWSKQYQQRVMAEQQHTGCNESEICKRMMTSNPKFILRNYLLDQCIQATEQEDFTLLEKLLKVVQTPFDEHPDHSHLSKPPETIATTNIMLSCSS